MWNQLSVEQKQNYGEDYFERALRSLEKYTEKVKWKFLKLLNNFTANKMVFWFYL